MSQKKTRIAKYTLPIFLERAKEIHGDKYDYNLILESHIKNKSSRITIICKTCDYKREISISSHITRQNSCPSCIGLIPWTYERFSERVEFLYPGKYRCSKIADMDIKNNRSEVDIICKKCDYQWRTSITNFVTSKGNCKSCINKLPWTLESFVSKATVIHNNMFDYSKITVDHIAGEKSKVPIICKICNYEWEVQIAINANRAMIKYLGR